MRLIDKWKDKYYFATNYIFESSNGLKIYYTHKPDIYKTYFAFSTLGGSQIESSLDIPDGTAHFAEHLLCNPNSTLKTQDKMNDFKFGNRVKPSIYTNAATSRKELWFNVEGNSKGFSRMLNYLKYQLQIKFSNLNKYIEEERGVILAEEHRYKPVNKDSSLAYDKFMIGEHWPEFAKRNLGVPESINKIKIEDIEKFIRTVFTVNNSYFAIQSSLEPTKDILKELDNFAKEITFFDGPQVKYKSKKYNPMFKKQHFFEESQQGLFFSLNYVQSIKDIGGYRNNVLRYLVDGALGYVARDILREKYNYVYSAEVFNSIYCWDLRLRGIKMIVKKENILNTFNILNSILKENVVDYLNSKKGNLWFKSNVSNYIFYPPTGVNPNYTFDWAYNHLLGLGIYNFDYGKSIEEAKKATIADVINDYKNLYENTPPALWLQSAYNQEEIYTELENSELFKSFRGI